MKTKFTFWDLLYLFIGLSVSILAQQPLPLNSSPQFNLEETLRRKIVSNKLVSDVKQGMLKNINRIKENESGGKEKVGVVIYFDEYPTDTEIGELEALGLSCYVNTWTPPLANHPYGFILAKLPPSKLEQTLAKQYIKKMDSSTHEAYPNNNQGTVDMMANSVWFEGYDGTGVKVAVLDSGIDDFYEGTDFPLGFERMDYSSYPGTTPDPDVANTVSGHGTHVVGSILGRGVLSDGNTGNGGGAYKGTAPGADLVFLKIGKDATGGASHEAIIGAMDAAVNIYNADILSMSYSGWYTYHDGSSAVEQKVDWVYSMGKPFFIAAGNEGGSGRHYSGTAPAGGETGFIQVNVSGAPTTGTYYFYFNLVWDDGIIGLGSTDLDLQFYDASMLPITTLSDGGQNESVSKATESEYFFHPIIPIADGTYYIKVFNNSGSSENFHIYEAWNGGKVSFQNPDPFYTIGQPASADNACAVGAHTTRSTWTDYSGGSWSFGNTQDDIAPFSSRGPRVDEIMKPDITAPGSMILSLRDTDVLTTDDVFTIDNDGNPGGDKNYYGMQGTSMACPLAAGAAALYLQYYPTASPQEVYDALQNTATADAFTGSVPNSTFGSGKLNIYQAIFDSQVDLEVVVYLEGAYIGGTQPMSTSLSPNIPTTQPFNVTPWLYDGVETLDPVPPNYTDWVLVELRSDKFAPSTYRKAALVNSFGGVFSFNGTPLKITAPPGDYWIVVHQRNHLSVMSSTAVTLSKVTPPTLPVVISSNIQTQPVLVEEKYMDGPFLRK
jgi:subtilisin family serine protease